MGREYLFTSESVTSGHPDKVADQISDAILDAYLEGDPFARVACETLVTTGTVYITGEISSEIDVDEVQIVRNTLREIGYADERYGMDADTCEVVINLDEQSADIAAGVDNALESRDTEEDILTGAGDQGLVFGYATNQTEAYLPEPIYYAHKLAKQLEGFRRFINFSGTKDILRPDGKTQVTVKYDGEEVKEIDTVVISAQHGETVMQEELETLLTDHVITEVIPPNLLTKNTKVLINPSGRFVTGGPEGDVGLTGRKIIVDTYGGWSRHGGGAFCVDKDTEYLTVDGWKKIDRYVEGDLVAQWDNGVMEYVQPEEYIRTKSDKMYKFETSKNVDMVLSQNHDIVYYTSKNNLKRKKVKDFIEQHEKSERGFGGRIPVSFEYDREDTDVELTEAQIRLQVAFCADGTFMGKYGESSRVNVKKENKKERLEKLLNETKTEYKRSDVGGGYTLYYFKPPVKTKQLNEVFKGASSEQLRVIAEEVQMWDGDIKEGIYRTTKKEEADFIQIVFMKVYGTSVSILETDRVGEVMTNGYIRRSIEYGVYIKKNKTVGFRESKGTKKPKIKEYEPEDGMMYCFSVPSGNLVLRRNNRVFVTGNSGKDSTKVDRSASYMARYIAKNIVAAKLAEECEVQLAYAIGKAEPVSVYVDTFGTAKGVAEQDIEEAVCKVFRLDPDGIIEQLDLRKPVFKDTAVYGHFGNSKYRWEQLDKEDELKKALV